VSDLAENAMDIGALVVVAEIARKYNDARAMLLVGKGALRRGFALDAYAFPTNGIPEFRMVGPSVDKSVVFADRAARKARSIHAPCRAPTRSA
jgi:soluble lytic murein transglycosylase